MKPGVPSDSKGARKEEDCLRKVVRSRNLSKSIPKSDSGLPSSKLQVDDIGSGPRGSQQQDDTSLQRIEDLSSISSPGQPSGPNRQSQPRTVEEKRILIRKQLIILLHAVVCKRREQSRGSPAQACNVPFCGLMKSVLHHLNSCKSGRNCAVTHCASSRQILVHWKFCVNATCCVCVSLRQMVPTSLLSIFPNPLCRSEILQRIARNQSGMNQDQTVPEIMESEE